MAEESELIKTLYEHSTALDNAGTDAGKHVEVYKAILNGAKAGPKARSLAAQLIPRYFKYFPNLQDEGISALTDLCEEEDMKIRILAVRAFPIVCKDTPTALPKAADILGQLLQTELQTEQDQVKHSLVALLRIDTKAVIKTMFYQILNRDESQRDKAIMFIKDKLFGLREELLNPHEDVERELAEHIKKALIDVSGEEFKIFMDLLSSLKIFKGQNSKELLDLLADQADLKSDFKPTEVDNVERLLTCMHLALPFLQKGTITSGHSFLTYLATKVLPSLAQLKVDHQDRLLQALAEMSPFASSDDARILLPTVYSLFKSHVPMDKDANLSLTVIEALLFTFHQLGAKATIVVSALCGIAPVYTGQPSDMVSVDDATTKLKEFTERLKFLSNKLETDIKGLNDAIKAFSTEKEKAQREKAAAALRTSTNILELIKPLLKQKPVFYGRQNSVRLSWQKDTKRKAPEAIARSSNTESNGNKKVRGGFQGVYTPPAKREGAPVAVQRGRGRGFRGGFRGRGRGRGF